MSPCTTPRRHPACAHVPEAGTVRCSHPGQGSCQVTQRGLSSLPGWRQQVHPHWGAHGTMVAPPPWYSPGSGSHHPGSFGNCPIFFQQMLFLLKLLFATKTTWTDAGKF